jgi:hypothetical protein
MKCPECGKFMAYESTYDFFDYYRCVDDCERKAIENPDSEIKNMDYADEQNNLKDGMTRRQGWTKNTVRNGQSKLSGRITCKRHGQERTDALQVIA